VVKFDFEFQPGQKFLVKFVLVLHLHCHSC